MPAGNPLGYFMPMVMGQAQQAAPEMPMGVDPFAGATPEQIQQILQLAALQGEQDLLAQQMAQAAALRNRPEAQSFTGAGAGLRALGDIASTIGGAVAQGRTRDEMRDVTQQQIQGRSVLADLLRQGGF